MTQRAHLSARAIPIALTIVTISVSGARGDSALPGYGRPGNALNPTGQILDLPRDPNGLSQLDDVTRTPTGLLYPLPFLFPEMKQDPSDPDWWNAAWVEAGLIGAAGTSRSAQFSRYADWNSGPLIGNFGFLAENRKTALYVSGLAENAGRKDQFYQMSVGRYGAFNVTAYFDSIPHTFSTAARSIWNGDNSAFHSLRDGLVPGQSTPAEVNAVAATVAPETLRVIREKAGVSLSYTPEKEWEMVLQLANEWRNGTQPISATFGYPFQNGATQIVQPVRYRTFDVTAAVRYKGDEMQANLTYTGSLFQNDIHALTWQNPGLTSIGGPVPLAGRLSLPPDNSYHSLKADFVWMMSPKSRFSASVSYALMRQDDPLLPPTVATGAIQGVAGLIDLAQWNTTAALNRLTAKAAIDNFNAFARYEYIASPSLTLQFELRDRSERNGTNYVAFNPQTGQYGYIALDGGLTTFAPVLSGVYEPGAPGSVVQIRNIPFANDNLELSARASYRMDRHIKLDLSYVHNAIHHSAREVPDADDNRVRIQVATNGYSWGTLRASYEFATLTGSEYMSNPYTPYYSQALPGYIPRAGGDTPFALTDLRKFDVGNRTEHAFRIQANHILSPHTDLQLTSDFKSDAYDARYGLRAATKFDLNAAFNYQMSLDTTMSGFFGFQAQNRGAANINPTGLGSDGSAGSADYPLANAWEQKLTSQDYSAGFNARHHWNAVTLTLNYTFIHSASALAYRYATPGAFFNTLTPAEAGTAFPDITYTAHLIEANLLWQFTERMSYRVLYRFDAQTLHDFHYAGLAPVLSDNTYLGVVPENYAAHVFGAFVQYRF